MNSSIAWLDTTAEEQRRARELIEFFTQQESRDELGIGQIRDAYSDMLFPGISVIQRRARYYLFVPWCYSRGRARGTSGDTSRAKGETQERLLIEALKAANVPDTGLVGKVAGASVKTLASAIYWPGLQRFNILTHDTDRSHLGLIDAAPDDATELAERVRGDWDAGLPEPPDGFPREMSSGFDLTSEEAEWLSGRIIVSTDGTALAYLLERGKRIPKSASAPWDFIPRGKFEALEHARWFSVAMDGAVLLYNLLIAERYEADPDLTGLVEPVAHFRQALEDWHRDDITPHARDLASWDVQRMWDLLHSQGLRPSPTTRLFVDAWISAVRDGRTANAADDEELRALIRNRELRKGSQSRLVNDKLLAMWSGGSGVGRLTYRWGTVREIVNDILKGRSNAPA